MSSPELPPRWSTGLLLSLALCCGCQRSLPRVGQHKFDAAAPSANPASPSTTAAEAADSAVADGGWKSTAAPALSTNGVPLTAEVTADTATTPVGNPLTMTSTPAAIATADLNRPDGQASPPPAAVPEIHQTQHLAAATDRDMETLRQRLEQQTQINAALTQAIVQLQRQTEAHHKALVQFADELNARQVRQDKVTEEILLLIDQMAGASPQPGSAPKATDSAAPSGGDTK